MRIFTRALACLAMIVTASPLLAAGHSLHVMDPWIQEAPPTAKVLAAYMTIKNQGDQPAVISGAHSEAFDKVELHATEMSGEMARMVHKKQVEIPAHSELVLAPGSYHLMLIGPKQMIHGGNKIDITLMLADGGHKTVTAVVRKAMMGHGAMDHSGHTMEQPMEASPAAMDHSQMQHNH